MNGKRVMKTKKPVALVALLLLLCCTVAGTLAYLVDSTDPVTNTFTPAHVSTAVDETFENGVKSDVKIKNTGDIPAYIRAAVIINWADKQGNISATPVNDSDYKMTLGSGWVKIGDYYYCKTTTAHGASTAPLIISCAKTPSAAVPDGYDLQVTILADGIQADGVGSNGKTPMEDAWGVTPGQLN